MKGWKLIRIMILLGILAWVGVDQLAASWNTTDWEEPLWVGVYPVAADGDPRVAKYVARLQEQDFAAVETWFAKEAARYGLPADALVKMRLGPVLKEMPPLPPEQRSLFANTRWSFALRSWANDHDTLPDGLKPDIRLFLLYYHPDNSPRLPHSLGLSKGLVGIVHVFADRRMRGSNQVVLTHEILHTLGATDKYDAPGNLPRYPDGYAEPAREPLYPQSLAEIMGGRIPVSADKAEIPESLRKTLIGPLTAREIRWDSTP